MDGGLLFVMAGAAALAAIACQLALGAASPARSGARGQTPLARLARRVLELAPVRRVREAEMRAQRRAACFTELPVLLDIVTLGLSAGLLTGTTQEALNALTIHVQPATLMASAGKALDQTQRDILRAQVTRQACAPIHDAKE